MLRPVVGLVLVALGDLLFVYVCYSVAMYPVNWDRGNVEDWF